jgi:hypothetical protein
VGGGRVAGFPSLGPAPHCGWGSSFDGAAAGGECCGAGRARCYPSGCKGEEEAWPSERPGSPLPRPPCTRSEDSKAPTPSPDGEGGRILLDDQEDDIAARALAIENEHAAAAAGGGRDASFVCGPPSVHRCLRGAGQPHRPDPSICGSMSTYPASPRPAAWVT